MPYRDKEFASGMSQRGGVRVICLRGAAAALCFLAALSFPLRSSAQDATDDARNAVLIQIRELCEEARSVAALDIGRAMQCTEKAAAIAERERNLPGMALASSIRGLVQVESMQWPEALHAYHTALGHYRRLGDSAAVAQTICALGDVHRYAGALSEARRSYEEALRALPESDASGSRADILFGLAAVLQLEDRPQAALAAYERCLAAARPGEKTERRSSCLNNMGAIRHARGEYATALSYYQSAIDLAERTGSTRRLIRLRINAAEAQLDAGRRETARSIFQQAFDQASRIRDIALMSAAHAGVMATVNRATRQSRESTSDIAEDAAGTGRSEGFRDPSRSDPSVPPHRNRSIDLVFEHESSRQQRELHLLKEQQKLQELALANEQESVRRLQLEAWQTEQELLLLQNEQENNEIKQDVGDAWLRHERTKGKDLENRLRLKEANLQLQAQTQERENLIRNGLIGGLVLLLIIVLLTLRRLKDRRRATELKAQIAEARAAALESEKRAGEFEARKRYTQLLIDSQEQERKRIAADLHDGIGQDLLVIKNRLTLALREQSRGGDPSHELEEISVAVSSSLQDIRRISRNLRPAQLDRIGLTSSIEAMIRTVRESTRLELHASLENIDGLFTKEREIDIYRIVQEGVNNIIKHAHASVAGITIQRHNGDVQVLIHDNGTGFAMEEHTRRGASAAEGFGLRGLYERTDILGGNINIDSAPGAGTRITVFLPVMKTPIPYSFTVSDHHGS